MAKGFSDAAEFVRAAAAGQIGIDQDHARSVLKKIRAGKDQVEALIAQTAELGVAPQLGANPVGAAIANKYADRAAGRGDSYAEALRNLLAQYDQVENALDTAIKNYDEIESANVDSLNRKV